MYACVCTCACLHAFLYVYVPVCMHVHVCVSACVFTHAHILALLWELSMCGYEKENPSFRCFLYISVNCTHTPLEVTFPSETQPVLKDLLPEKRGEEETSLCLGTALSCQALCCPCENLSENLRENLRTWVRVGTVIGRQRRLWVTCCRHRLLAELTIP